MVWKLHGKGYQCMGRQAHGLQSARAHAKCAGPRKVRGPTQSARAALWVRERQVRGRARNAWAAVQLRGPHWVRGPQLRGEVGGWAALPTHLPRTCHSMPTQCNRVSTRVGRDEPQSPGTLRVNTLIMCIFYEIYLLYVLVSGVTNVTRLTRFEPWPRDLRQSSRNFGFSISQKWSHLSVLLVFLWQYQAWKRPLNKLRECRMNWWNKHIIVGFKKACSLLRDLLFCGRWHMLPPPDGPVCWWLREAAGLFTVYFQ